MIGWLRGKLKSKDKSSLLLEIAGVGYEVQVSLLTYCRLPECGAELELFTHFIVREDEQTLYGFTEIKERALFRILLKVNGVGPKLALTILSSIDPDSLVMMVKENDSHRLMKTPGIGKKTAERLVIELSDRLKDWSFETEYDLALKNVGSGSNASDSSDGDRGAKDGTNPCNGAASTTSSVVNRRPYTAVDATRDAVSALIGLGYTPQEASRAVAEVTSDKSIENGSQESRLNNNVEHIIRLALKGMVARDRV
jgi:Holliday junction DNA helicase RuvA